MLLAEGYHALGDAAVLTFERGLQPDAVGVHPIPELVLGGVIELVVAGA